MQNITSPAVTRHCGGTQKANVSHVRYVCVCGGGGGGRWLQMTGALRIKLPKFGK